MQTLVGREYSTMSCGFKLWAEGDTGDPRTQDFDMAVGRLVGRDGEVLNVMTPAGQLTLNKNQVIYIWPDNLVARATNQRAGDFTKHSYHVTEYFRWIPEFERSPLVYPDFDKTTVKRLISEEWGGLPVGWYLCWEFTLETWCIGRKDGENVGKDRLLELGDREVQIRNTLKRHLWVVRGVARPEVYREDIEDLILVYLGEGWQGYKLVYDPNTYADGSGSWFYTNEVATIELGNTIEGITKELDYFGDYFGQGGWICLRDNKQVDEHCDKSIEYVWQFVGNRKPYYIGDYNRKSMTLRWEREGDDTVVVKE